MPHVDRMRGCHFSDLVSPISPLGLGREFKKLVPTSFLILNAEEEGYSEYCLKVLLEIPVVKSHFWIETEDVAARAFLDRFNSMCTNGGILEMRNGKKC